METRDLAPRHRKKPQRILLAQILFRRKRQPPDVVERLDAVRADAATREFRLVKGDVRDPRDGVLKARKLVSVRGAGNAFDGLYYVKSVTHNIKRGEYKQSFTLSRNGLISTLQKVPV